MHSDLHIEVFGSGPPLLLIHGGAPGATGRGNFGENLESLAQRFQVFLADLPGSGKSQPLQFQSSDPYAELAEHFLEHMDSRGVGRFHVLGMATGAGIGIVLAALHPERVDRLIAVAPPGGHSAWHPSPSEGSKAMNSYFKDGGPSREKMRNYLELTVVDPALISEEILDERLAESERQWTEIQAGKTTSKASPAKILQHAPAVIAKTLVVWGLQNRLQSATNFIDFLQAIPDAEAHIYKDAGLWVPFEKQKEFNNLVMSFLDTP